MPVEALKRSHTVTSFEPFTLLSALSMGTEKIGLAATASTTYDKPYHIARRFASFDHLSNGHAAWNIITTRNPDFADDVFIRDQKSGMYFDPEKMHVLDHKGDDLKVKGPLNMRALFKASQSEPGRQLAAKTAKAVFCSPLDLEAAKVLYVDIKGRVVAAGRDQNHLKILPAAFIVIRDTVKEARENRLKLDSLVHYDSALASLSIAPGTEASDFDPDSPLPTDIPRTNASKTSQASVIKFAKQEKLILAKEVADGFTVILLFLPQGLDDVADWLVPELQRRGLFRKEYEGTTLREHLGLPRPKNLL
ncbi:related to coenzyme F420-dependent N5,N10-methylene tetrahydromethanopterin reductase and related flavin-dependent oxidoreductases [Phialocephala subalpina]|uniref:Related to coenzyme F420-dependent N5,N10-methylene tetrahydromethanopterin reductase and related flavin-dependent oxidoreductases n=1 Tax=Phialocephala subalpina TaxID=576137 RepID=A0A1L7X398_9HELO|nr:related to coenzyme F420-dependent N5,N10-methylene tetrahydromethanopterin reductase and related flavin-dependent oxidoreductases [Phialocephala subalpina]